MKVFEGLVATGDTNGVGHVWQSPLGNLVYSAPGETNKHAFQFDKAAFKFVAIP